MVLVKKIGTKEHGTLRRLARETMFLVRVFAAANSIILVSYLVQIMRSGTVRMDVLIWSAIGLNGLIIMTLPVKWLNDRFAYFSFDEHSIKHVFKFPNRNWAFGNIKFGLADTKEIKVDDTGKVYLLVRNSSGSSNGFIFHYLTDEEVNHLCNLAKETNADFSVTRKEKLSLSDLRLNN